MFDIASTELLLIVVVAVIVIGPKDLPRALYKLGQVVGKARGMARHFRTGIDAMVREAELEDLQKQWAKQNQEIMERTRGLDTTSASSTAVPSDVTSADGSAVADPSAILSTDPEPATPSIMPPSADAPAKVAEQAGEAAQASLPLGAPDVTSGPRSS